MATYLDDGFDRTVASGLGDADSGDDTNKTWALTNVTASVSPSTASITITTGPADGQALVGDSHTGTIDVGISYTAFPGGNKSPGDGVILRHNGSVYYSLGYDNDNNLITLTKTGSVKATAVGDSPGTGAANIRGRAVTVGSTVVISYKYWLSGDEPASWTSLYTDTTSPILAGQYGIYVEAGPSTVTRFWAEGADATPDPGLPGGADDPSRAPPTSDAWSRKSLTAIFDPRYALPPLPPKQPSPSQSLRARRKR